MEEKAENNKRMRYTKNVREPLDRAERQVSRAIDLNVFNASPLKQREKAIMGALLKANCWEDYRTQRDEFLQSNEDWKAEEELSEDSFDNIYQLQEEYINRVGGGWKARKSKKDIMNPVRLTAMADKKVWELWKIYELACDIFDTQDTEEIKQKLGNHK